MNKLIIHGHALYKVSDKLFGLICLQTIGVDKDKYYDIIMNLLATNVDEFQYIDQVHFKG